MQKMLIQLDVEKIEREDKYDINKMWKVIDEVFEENNCIKEENADGSVTYWGDPKIGNYLADFGLAYITLSRTSWFLENASKWIWYDNDEDESEPFDELDTLHRVKKRMGII